MPSIEINVMHSVGLHARPASQFVQLAMKFPCEIMLSNLTSGSEPVNAKSILGVLSLGVNQGNKIRIDANGESSEDAIESLTSLVNDNFGENAA